MTSYTREEIRGLALVGRMVAREGKRDELLHVLDEAVAVCSQHEPDGALMAIFHTSPSNPDMVVLYQGHVAVVTGAASRPGRRTSRNS